ncbi:MAG: O-methyltransferase [Deltaproteobacteria bacterium]|nr:O-methyltransferase [Deltaproteobacteria bacterium]
MTTTANKTYGCDDPTTATYASRLLALEDEVLAGIRRRAEAAGLPDIHVSAADGRHLQVLAAAMGARNAVEVGTLAGYSGVCLLRGMAPGGILHTLELDPKHAEVARKTFRLAGLTDRARIHVGPADQTLGQLSSEGPFDLVFLDADKAGYPRYLGWAAEHLRPGGVVLADNVFLWGNVGRTEPLEGMTSATVGAMRTFNERVVQSERWLGTLLPTGEGLAMGVKR